MFFWGIRYSSRNVKASIPGLRVPSHNNIKGGCNAQNHTKQSPFMQTGKKTILQFRGNEKPLQRLEIRKSIQFQDKQDKHF